MKKLLSVVTALSFLSPTFAVAAGGEKASSPAGGVCAAGRLAHLSTAGGKVLLSRGGSFSEIQDGATLTAGDRILVRDGSASVVVGKSVVSQAVAGSMLTITERDGGICAAQVTSHPAVVAQAEDLFCRVRGPGLSLGEFDIDPVCLGIGGLAIVGLGVGLGVGLSGGGGNNNNAALLALAGVSH